MMDAGKIQGLRDILKKIAKIEDLLEAGKAAPSMATGMSLDTSLHYWRTGVRTAMALAGEALGIVDSLDTDVRAGTEGPRA
jgi:hypothetical protein